MTVFRNDDPYTDTASGVLRNELGITDAEELELAEGAHSATRSYQLQEMPLEGNFDLKHLQAIHKHLFQDVYDWAGKLRTVDISKGREKFAHPDFIESAGAPIFRELAKEKHLAGLEPADFSGRAAYYMGEINILHPFREGNSRALREFVSHLAKQNDCYIAWERVTHDETQRGSLEAFHGDTSTLSALIEQNLHSFEHDEEIQQTRSSLGVRAAIQGAVSRKAEQSGETKPALSPEAAARGLTWDMRGPDAEMRPDQADAELMHDGHSVASVYEFGPSGPEFVAVDTWGVERGDLQDGYATLDEGMRAAETWAVYGGLKLHEQQRDTEAALESMRVTSPENPFGFFTRPSVEQLGEASRSFFSREASSGDRDASRGFDMER